MTLPFSEQQFLDVFGAYNSGLWPTVMLLWIATLWFDVQLVRGRARSAALSLLLTFHWARLHVAPDAVLFIAGAAVAIAAIARTPGPSRSVLATTSGAKQP